MYFHSKIAYFLCSTQKFWPFSSVLRLLQTFFTYCFLLKMNLLLGLECSTWFIYTFHNTYVILKKPPSESKLLYIMTESLSRHRKVLSKVLGRERGAMRQWQLSGPSTRQRKSLSRIRRTNSLKKRPLAFGLRRVDVYIESVGWRKKKIHIFTQPGIF